jgi:molecular chaperone HscA
MLIETRNEADTVMTHVERALRQGASLLEAAERQSVETALAALKAVRDTQDRDAIRETTTALNRATEPLAERMMDAALKGALGTRRATEILESE